MVSIQKPERAACWQAALWFDLILHMLWPTLNLIWTNLNLLQYKFKFVSDMWWWGGEEMVKWIALQVNIEMD